MEPLLTSAYIRNFCPRLNNGRAFTLSRLAVKVGSRYQIIFMHVGGVKDTKSLVAGFAAVSSTDPPA